MSHQRTDTNQELRGYKWFHGIWTKMNKRYWDGKLQIEFKEQCIIKFEWIKCVQRGSVNKVLQFSSVQSLSHVWLFVTPCTAAWQASLSITNSQSLLKLISIKQVMKFNHLILCRPLYLLPSVFPSIRVFSNESAFRIRLPKYWSFSFNISLSNEYSGLISFRIDWLDLFSVQETLKSLLQQHSSKASILRCSAFFIDQLSHPYMTTGKTIALTRWAFVGKVMSMLFNMPSRLVRTFLFQGVSVFLFHGCSHHLHLHLGGALVPLELKDNCYVYSPRRNQDFAHPAL